MFLQYNNHIQNIIYIRAPENVKSESKLSHFVTHNVFMSIYAFDIIAK